MQTETASIYAEGLIKILLRVHALTNMHRSSGDDEYRKGASSFLPDMHLQLAALERALNEETSDADHG